MKQLIAFIYFACVCISLQAQVNFVRNPGLEDYSKCPDAYDQIIYARYWSTPLDSTTTAGYQMEYFNSCAAPNMYVGLPFCYSFQHFAHSGKGMAGMHMYYDKKPPYPPPGGPIPRNYRDYLQGRFFSKLEAGKQYCVSFFVNLAATSHYSQNKIGAFIDDGTFDDTVTIPGSEMTFVTPQVFTDSVVGDTAKWFKIEGSFIAKGGEHYITIGNFFDNSSVTAISTGINDNYSYYGIDDISVIPLDLAADAGPNTWVGKGDSMQIGRVGDTTAFGLDCRWYHKGNLIDSGATIWVKGYGMVGDMDTYSVVQTICGLIKSDTVVVYTVPTGIHELPKTQRFNVYPNPSNGKFYIWSPPNVTMTNANLQNMVGKSVWHEQLSFSGNKAAINTCLPDGLYLLTLTDESGQSQQLKLNISSTE